MHRLLVALFAIEWASTIAWGQVEVSLTADHSVCEYGQPAILTIVFANKGTEPITTETNYSWCQIGAYQDDGFTLEFAKDGEDKRELIGSQGLAAVPPLQFDFFVDAQSFRAIGPGKRIQRTELLLLKEPGDYEIRALFQHADGRVDRSKPIRVTVKPFPPGGKLDGVCTAEDLLAVMGDGVYPGYYCPMFVADDSMLQRLDDLASAIRAADPESAYLEHLEFALTLGKAHSYARQPIPRDSVRLREVEELAAAFAKAYPHSLYRPALLDPLFEAERCAGNLGDPAWAVAFGREAIDAEVPHAAVSQSVFLREFAKYRK